MKFQSITVLIIANISIKIKILYLHNFNKYMYFTVKMLKVEEKVTSVRRRSMELFLCNEINNI